MGCDFYIYKYLEILHTNGVAYYALPTERGYYAELGDAWYDSDVEFNYDEDETNITNTSKAYNKLCSDMMKLYLMPREPLVIFENGIFLNSRLEEKYLEMLKNKIQHIYLNNYCVCGDSGGVLNDLNSIIKVTKKEVRAEPGEGPELYYSRPT